MDWFRIDLACWAVFGLVWLAGAPFSRRTVQRESLLSRASYGVFLMAAMLMIFGDRPFTRVVVPLVPWLGARLFPAGPVAGAAGVVLTVLGIAFAIWARVTLGRLWSGTITLKEGHRLLRSGPYGLARHPIYTGMLAGLLGTAISVGELRCFLGVALASVAFLRKIALEERLLAARFGDEHRDYRQRVRKLIPFVW